MVVNLTQKSRPECALIVDVSTGGMRLESSLTGTPGDALQIDLPYTVLLAETVYCSGRTVGVKLYHSLSREELLRCVQPELWAA